MVYRRKYGRRRAFGRRRTARRGVFKRGRRMYKRRVSRGGKSKLMSFKRMAAQVNIPIYNATGAGSNSAAWDFRFNQLVNYSEFSALWDNYKINSVVIKFAWHNAPAEESTIAGTYPAPVFHCVIDDNDATSVPTIDAMSEFSSYKRVMMNHAMTWGIKLYPKSQTAMYRTALTTAYGPKKQWINMSYPDVPHYGLKWLVDGGQGGGTGTLVLGTMSYQIWTYFQVRNTK